MPIAPRHQAIGVRLEPLAGSRSDATLIGGEYLRGGSHFAWGVHAGGVVEAFPPRDPVLANGGTAANAVGPICPAVSITRWSPHVEGFSRVPGDSDRSILLFRIGVGLAHASGDSLRLVAWFYPHVTVERTHSTFGDMESTDSEREFLTDVGAAIGGGRFWASGAARFQFADDPGEDIPIGATFLVRAGVRF